MHLRPCGKVGGNGCWWCCGCVIMPPWGHICWGRGWWCCGSCWCGGCVIMPPWRRFCWGRCCCCVACVIMPPWGHFCWGWWCCGSCWCGCYVIMPPCFWLCGGWIIIQPGVYCRCWCGKRSPTPHKQWGPGGLGSIGVGQIDGAYRKVLHHQLKSINSGVSQRRVVM